MFYLNTVIDCLLSAFDSCINLCYSDLREDKGKIYHSDKKSPFRAYKQMSYESVQESEDITKETNDEKISLLNPFNKIKDVIPINEVFGEVEIKKPVVIDICFDKNEHTLSFKVYPSDDVPDKFDICILGSPEFTPRRATFKKTRTFLGVYDKTLKICSLNIKFYEESADAKDMVVADITYSLLPLVSVEIDDNKKRLKVEIMPNFEIPEE